MTIDEERFRTIENVRSFLEGLLDRSKPIPQTKELRQRAYRLLKHYPEAFWMRKLKEEYFKNAACGKEKGMNRSI